MNFNRDCGYTLAATAIAVGVFGKKAVHLSQNVIAFVHILIN